MPTDGAKEERLPEGPDVPAVPTVPPDDAGQPSRCNADMAGYDPASPWPVAGHCPEQGNRAFAKSPRAPSIRWKVSVPQGYFGGHVIGAKETVFTALQAKRDASGFELRVAAIRDGAFLWNVAIPAERGSSSTTPTLAVDGSVLVMGEKALYSLEAATGEVRWTTPISADTPARTPLVLGNGTIVVPGKSDVYAFGLDGASMWTYSLTKARIVQNVAITPTGEILVPIADDAALTGAILALSPSGERLWSAALSSWPRANPVVTSAGSIYVASSGRLFGLTNTGAQAYAKALPTTFFEARRPVVIDDAICFFEGGSRCFLLDASTGNVSELSLPEFAGRVYSAIGTAEGDLVYYVVDVLASTGHLVSRKADGTNRWSLPLVTSHEEGLSMTMGSASRIYVGVGDTLFAVYD